MTHLSKWLLLAAGVALAVPAQAEAPKVSQPDYDKMEGCLGKFDGVTWVLVDLAPRLNNPSDAVSTVISNKELSGKLSASLRKIEKAQPELDKLEAGAAYTMAKQPWDDVRKQGDQAEFDYWKANGANTDECTMMIMRITVLGEML